MNYNDSMNDKLIISITYCLNFINEMSSLA